MPRPLRDISDASNRLSATARAREVSMSKLLEAKPPASSLSMATARAKVALLSTLSREPIASSPSKPIHFLHLWKLTWDPVPWCSSRCISRSRDENDDVSVVCRRCSYFLLPFAIRCFFTPVSSSCHQLFPTLCSCHQ